MPAAPDAARPSRNSGPRDPLWRELWSILVVLRALNLLYHHAHVNVRGTSFYGDHTLLQRLYLGEDDQECSTIEEIDSLMEHMLAMWSNRSLDPVQLSADVAALLREALAKTVVSGWQQAWQLETLLQDNLRNALALSRGMPDLENHLQGVADTHRHNLYLLERRMGDDAPRSREAVPVPAAAVAPAATAETTGNQWPELGSDPALDALRDDWPPSDEDAFIQDAKGGGYEVFYIGRQILGPMDWDDLIAALNDWMTRQSYWPNVWYVNERGNTTLIKMPAGEHGPGVVGRRGRRRSRRGARR